MSIISPTFFWLNYKGAKTLHIIGLDLLNRADLTRFLCWLKKKLLHAPLSLQISIPSFGTYLADLCDLTGSSFFPSQRVAYIDDYTRRTKRGGKRSGFVDDSCGNERGGGLEIAPFSVIYILAEEGEDGSDYSYFWWI